MARELRRHALELRFASSPEEAWRIVADTDAMDAAAGLPAIQYRDEPQPDGTSRRFFHYRLKGLPCEGEEHPFTWEHPRRFEVLRDFSRGPFAWSRHAAEVEAVDAGRPEAGSIVRQVFEFEPRGPVGRVFAWGFGRDVLPAMRAHLLARDRKSPARAADGEAEDGIAVDRGSLEALPRATAAQVERVEALMQAARQECPSPALDRIAEAVLHRPDRVLHRMRPYALARTWGLDGRETVRAFLAATEAGVLKLRWDVLCPHCRGDKANLASLAEVKPRAYCASCNIDFDVDLHRSLEAVFTPHPQVREVSVARYCLGGPGRTPHILYQRRLEPGEAFAPAVDLPPGRYRLRVSGAEVFRWVDAVEPGGAGAGGVEAPPGEEAAFTVEDRGLDGDDLRLEARRPRPVAVRNASSRRVLAVIERVEWAQDALQADDLLTEQRFRDRFSGEMLAPGVGLAVERVAVLFTDLVGSTAMYGRLGDARAFRLVWEHFDVLQAVIDAHRGARVKTIGDAVMAAFPRPGDALLAAAELHERLEAALATGPEPADVGLKVGLHAGPCIAVTLNARLDYFGTTVNLAARVQAQSRGGDVVVSRALADEVPEAVEALRLRGWRPEVYRARVKGFDDEVELVRFTRGAGVSAQAPREGPPASP